MESEIPVEISVVLGHGPVDIEFKLLKSVLSPFGPVLPLGPVAPSLPAGPEGPV